MQYVETRRGALGDEFVEGEERRDDVHAFAEEVVDLRFTLAFVG